MSDRVDGDSNFYGKATIINEKMSSKSWRDSWLAIIDDRHEDELPVSRMNAF